MGDPDLAWLLKDCEELFVPLVVQTAGLVGKTVVMTKEFAGEIEAGVPPARRARRNCTTMSRRGAFEASRRAKNGSGSCRWVE